MPKQRKLFEPDGTLTVERANAACAPFESWAETILSTLDQLSSWGYSAFRPIEECAKSFCGNYILDGTE